MEERIKILLLHFQFLLQCPVDHVQTYLAHGDEHEGKNDP